MNAVNIIGAGGKRREHDFYSTPPDVTEALLNFLEDYDAISAERGAVYAAFEADKGGIGR